MRRVLTVKAWMSSLLSATRDTTSKKGDVPVACSGGLVATAGDEVPKSQQSSMECVPRGVGGRRRRRVGGTRRWWRRRSRSHRVSDAACDSNKQIYSGSSYSVVRITRVICNRRALPLPRGNYFFGTFHEPFLFLGVLIFGRSLNCAGVRLYHSYHHYLTVKVRDSRVPQRWNPWAE